LPGARIVEAKEKNFINSHPAVGNTAQAVDLGLKAHDTRGPVAALQGRAVLGPELFLDHGDSLREWWLNRPEGAENRRKATRERKYDFSLASDRFLGESRSCEGNEIPRFTPDCTARHWRALLFLGSDVLDLEGVTQQPRCIDAGV
jgi:hypothetical protein